MPEPSTALDVQLRRWFPWLVVLGVLVNLSGLTVTVMEPDAALYGTIARNMAESGDFLSLVARGTDWLDKPHLPFWATAASFRLFGVNTVAYKLAAVPFWALALVYTFLFARRFYGPTVARLAVLVVLTAEHLILSNNDVRAEPFMVGTIVGSLYHLTVAERRRVLSLHLVAGAFLAALAMMTKGPFVLIPIAGGLATQWIVERRWREFLDPRWYLALLLVGVFILPELYALYVQFDLHPEKVVFGRTGYSGLRFFFWDSQFGRFMNTGPIRGKGDPTFFLHTLLWAFLPWSLWLYGAVGARIAERVRRSGTAPEHYSWSAAGLAFLEFSLSRFQLPHYINILFPFFAVITAAWVHRHAEKAHARAAVTVQRVVLSVMLALAPALLWFARCPNAVVGVGALLALAFGVLLWTRVRTLPAAVVASVAVAAGVNLVLNLAFYPDLLRYQAGSEAAALVDTLPERRLGLYGVNSYALELYAPPKVERWELPELKEAARAGAVYVFLFEEDVAQLEAAGLRVRPVGRFEHFRVTQLKGRFLNPLTRASAVRHAVLAEVSDASAPPHG